MRSIHIRELLVGLGAGLLGVVGSGMNLYLLVGTDLLGGGWSLMRALFIAYYALGAAIFVCVAVVAGLHVRTLAPRWQRVLVVAAVALGVLLVAVNYVPEGGGSLTSWTGPGGPLIVLAILLAGICAWIATSQRPERAMTSDAE